MGFTVVSMSLSLVAVFIPFMFAGGIVGLIFREFTVTLSVSILISLVISLTTTPMMCSLLLRARRRAQAVAVRARPSSAAFERCAAATSARSTGHCATARIMMLLLGATIGLNVYLYIVIPKGFFPQQDTGQLQGGIRGDASSSFQLMKRKLQEVAAIVQADPAVDTVTGSVGRRRFRPGGGGGASANVTIALKPLAERRDLGGSGHRAFAAEARPRRRRIGFPAGRAGHAAAAADPPTPSINTRCSAMIWPSCAAGRRSFASRCRTCPKSPTSIPICSPAAWRPI